MGNNSSGNCEEKRENSSSGSTTILFLVRKLWSFVTGNWTFAKLSTVNTTLGFDYKNYGEDKVRMENKHFYDIYNEEYNEKYGFEGNYFGISQYSSCSCSICFQDDDLSSYSSELFQTAPLNNMAPNSEDTRCSIESLASSTNEETPLPKEKQRPPIYNPEDYSSSLKKWGRRSSNNMGAPLPCLYATPTNENVAEKGNNSSNSSSSSKSFQSNGGEQNGRDYRNPMLTSATEMTLRQFNSVTELLAKLKADLRLAYPSFVQEFVSDPLDGITLLLEVLRSIQMSQSTSGAAHGTTGANNGPTIKISPAIQRRAHLDELACLQCLSTCCSRYSESVRKLTAISTGLFTLSVCIMSNVNKSRIIALQLLVKACEPSVEANASVSEALSTMRLRFGEPVRFRFLVGMLSSAAGSQQGELLFTGLKFLNTFLRTAGSVQKKLYVQAELEQAGFDVSAIKKNVNFNSTFAEQIFNELDLWDKNHVDAEYLTMRLEDLESENDSLRDKVLLLERKIQILQEEKGVLVSLEKCLQDKCSELQDEVTSLKSCSKTSSIKIDIDKENNSRCTPEDEGISSSERSITPEDDDDEDSPSSQRERESSVYEVYSIQQNETIMKPQQEQQQSITLIDDDDDDETTIEQVVEELRNIVNDVESQLISKHEIQMRVDSNVTYNEDLLSIGVGTESEIVPTNLHPRPPRKTRSLVHLFFSNSVDYDDCYRNEIFFDSPSLQTQHHHYASDESSDSLLSASKYHQQPQTQYTLKSKSLDRIDDGLDAIVDIVVTHQDSIIVDNPLAGGDGSKRSMLAEVSSKDYLHHQVNYENPKMFLPNAQDKFEEPQSIAEGRYYFPRVQEKKANNSFHIKRGHANAGMYSGQSFPSKSDFFSGVPMATATTGSRNSSSKLTDYPSGLY